MDYWLVHLNWSKKNGFSSYTGPDINRSETGSCNEEQICSQTDSALEDPSRCCCRTIDIKNGAYAVAFFYALIIVSNLCIRALKAEEVEWNWQLLFLISDSVSVVCLFYGVARRRPAFLQPFTVVSILTISFCILLAMFYGAAVANPRSYYGEQVEIWLADKVQILADNLAMSQKDVVVSTSSVACLMYACTGVIHSWFLVIVVRCAQHFRNIEKEALIDDFENDQEKPEDSNENSIQINQEDIQVL